MIQLAAYSLSHRLGLNFIVYFAFYLMFTLLLWYLIGTGYKSNEERRKHNKFSILLFLIIILLTFLGIVGAFSFFPLADMSLRADYMAGIPLLLLIMFVGAYIADRMGAKRLKENKR